MNNKLKVNVINSRLNITEEKMNELKYTSVRLYKVNHRVKKIQEKREGSINKLWELKWPKE